MHTSTCIYKKHTYIYTYIHGEVCAYTYAFIHAYAHDLRNRGADVNIADYNGSTALHYACEEGYDELVQFLLAVMLFYVYVCMYVCMYIYIYIYI
jgi:hypothetical protein